MVRDHPIGRKQVGRPRRDGNSKSKEKIRSKKSPNRKPKTANARLKKPKVAYKHGAVGKANLNKMKKAELIEELENTRVEVKRSKEDLREKERESNRKMEQEQRIQISLKEDAKMICSNFNHQIRSPMVKSHSNSRNLVKQSLYGLTRS